MTKQTLEKILGLLSRGFTIPRKEVAVGTIIPCHKEHVGVEWGHPAYISEGGGDVAARETRYSGCREYSSSSGKYLFKESLPLKEESKWEGCVHCGGYRTYTSYPLAISKSAEPAIRELKTVRTKFSGKLFGLPWTVSKTQVILPSERINAIHGIYINQKEKGKVPLSWGFK